MVLLHVVLGPELINTSPALDFDRTIGSEGEFFLEFDEGAELGLSVSDVELSLLKDNFRMLS